MRTLGLIIALIMTAAGLMADGGTVLLHQEAEPYIVTVFASPSQVRAGGTVDLSVLVQIKETLEPALDVNVDVTLIHGSSRIQTRATREQTQNKLLSAVSVVLPQPGDWSYEISIRNARLTGTMTVAGPEPRLEAYAGYLAFPFICLAVLALHQWLRISGRKHPGRRPAETGFPPPASELH